MQAQGTKVEEKSNTALVQGHQKREKSKLVQSPKGRNSRARHGRAERAQSQPKTAHKHSVHPHSKEMGETMVKGETKDKSETVRRSNGKHRNSMQIDGRHKVNSLK